jgi:hypothetical protein
MRLRRTALCVLALALVAPSAAYAKKPPPKPKPKACNLLVDATGDGTWSLMPVVKSPALDIVSGDIATGPKYLVAVLRMASTDLAADTYSNLGYSWTFAATSLGVSYTFSVRTGIGRTGKPIAGASAGSTGVPFDFKIEGSTYKWTVKRSDLPNLARPRNIFSEFRAQTDVESSSADTALTTTTRYADKAPSCVAAG